MFGVDKTLTSSVRIEKSAAKDDKKRNSKLDLPDLIESIKAVEIEAEVSDNPKNSLCNDAYWQALTKYAGRAVFIHIPTIKYADEMFLDKLKRVFTVEETMCGIEDSGWLKKVAELNKAGVQEQKEEWL